MKNMIQSNDCVKTRVTSRLKWRSHKKKKLEIFSDFIFFFIKRKSRNLGLGSKRHDEGGKQNSPLDLSPSFRSFADCTS